MAKKKEEEKKVVLERTYIVPLRKEWLKSPKWKRSKKAVKALKEFAAKHMKAETVKLGKYINKELWKHGIKNPPHKVKVNCSKDDKGIVTVELFGAPVEKKEEEKKDKKTEEKKEAKAETKKSEEEIKKAMTELEKKTEAVKKEKEVKTEEKPKEEKPAEKKEEPKEQPKAEATPKEVKKEEPKTPEKQ